MYSLISSAIFVLLVWSSHFLSIATARPAFTSQRSTFLSLPLSRATGANAATGLGEYLHGSIVQQQHINRGTKRLALMTGGDLPSDIELLWNMHQRISHLSDALKRKYEFEAIAGVLADHYAVDPAHLSSVIYELVPSLEKKEVVADCNPLHSIGLDIESADVGYIGKMQIGTPPKDYRLLVDSGSADLWVGAEGCQCDDGGGCGDHTFLGPHSSSTFVRTKEEWAIGYVTGSVSGYLVQDVVSIAGLTLSKHTFGVAQNESSDFTGDNIPFDGLLGLAKPDLSAQRTATLLQSLHQAGLIQSSIVSYKLPRLADGPKNTGELTLGAMDSKHYDPRSLVRVRNINKFGFWGVAVDAVNVGTHNMHWSNRTVVMDTGTTLMIAPQQDVDAIHKLIPGAKPDGSGGWTVPCNMTTKITLTISRQPFAIDPRDIAFYPIEPDSPECMSGIAVGGVGPFYQNNEWLVGDVFLKNVYFSTNEDNDTVSIAKPKF